MEAKGECKLTLKLLIDTKASKVLFAEAGKDFVDFLFHVLSLPVGTIVNLLSVNGMVGSLGALYKSVESLSTDYFQANQNKDSVLKPRAPVSVPLLSLNDAPPAEKRVVYRCNTYDCLFNHFTETKGTACPSCRGQMNSKVSYVGDTTGKNTTVVSSAGAGDGGYVKGVITYMVMDNLEVKPMSTISGITMMNKFQVKDVSSLEEKEVQVGLTQGVSMLKASLETSAVLTSVFLGNKM